MLSEREGEGEAGRRRGCGVTARGGSMVEEEKSTSEPEREALLRWRRRASEEDEGGWRMSLERSPRPVERIEMLEDLVRLGR